MGPSESKAKSEIDVSINHPMFENAKFVSNGKDRYIETLMGVDEKDYKKWHEDLSKNKPDPRFLLLPVK